MIKKRVVGVVTVRNGWAVQSFGYERYLPLGKPEVLIENLDHWGADEIILQCIDRNVSGAGPDMEVLEKIKRLGISTPLIYSGGIRCQDDAIRAISYGADRVMVDSMMVDSPSSVEAMSRQLGAQAVILNLPINIEFGELNHLDYRSGKQSPLVNWLKQKSLEWVSEIMLTDWIHEGSRAAFDERLLGVTRHIEKPLICFGGISEPQQINSILEYQNVVAVAVGNFLSYREHALQALVEPLTNNVTRPAFYDDLA